MGANQVNPNRMNRLVATAVLSLTGAQAMAMAVAGPNGTVAQGRRIVHAAPATPSTAAADKPHDLSTGQIETVNLGKAQVVISGKTMALHPGSLRVVTPSGQIDSSASSLRKGMNVRFALDPASKAVERPIVLMYIEK